jgi:hypothetical protein
MLTKAEKKRRESLEDSGSKDFLQLLEKKVENIVHSSLK